MAVKPSSKYLANTNSSRYISDRDGMSMNNELLYRRRFKKQGRTLHWVFQTVWTEAMAAEPIFPRSFFTTATEQLLLVIDQNFENSNVPAATAT